MCNVWNMIYSLVVRVVIIDEDVGVSYEVG